MRKANFACLALALLGAAPLAAHETPVDPALHCAALIEMSGRMLAAADQLAPEEGAALDQARAAILRHSALPENQRETALEEHIIDIAAHHTDAEISDEIAQKSKACLKDYGG